jgi:predicted NBD/HSP70 family sugar kinase
LSTTFTAVTSDAVRRLNLSRLLRQVHVHGNLTRSELVADTGLNRSTVAGLIREFEDVGLVEEVAGRAGGVGRPSLGVAPIPSAAVVAAFDVRVDHVVAAVMGLGGVILARTETEIPDSQSGPDDLVRALVQTCEQMFHEVPEGAAWVGTGVSLPGVIDPESGWVRVAPNLGWRDVDLAALLADALAEHFSGSPAVALANDANAGVLAEVNRGAGRSLSDLIFLLADVGIGAGIMVGGRLMTGTSGFAGEVGHLIVNPNGRSCRCGNRGCWETEIGRDAVLRTGTGNRVSVEQVMDAARAGDENAILGLKEMIGWLGIGLVNLINSFNPQAIILGGHLSALMEALDADIRDTLPTLWSASSNQLQLVTPTLGQDASLIGAAELAFEDLLSNPLVEFERSPHLVSA